jgi:hypothetical protein
MQVCFHPLRTASAALVSSPLNVALPNSLRLVVLASLLFGDLVTGGSKLTSLPVSAGSGIISHVVAQLLEVSLLLGQLVLELQ